MFYILVTIKSISFNVESRITEFYAITPISDSFNYAVILRLSINTTVRSWGEELCPVSNSLPLRVHKLYIRVSFSDTFLRWLPPFVTNSCHYQQRKKPFPFIPYWGVDWSLPG